MNFKETLVIRILIISAILLVIPYACTIENLDDVVNIQKSDFSSFNYVLATEDASDEDITTFYAFNLSEIEKGKAYDLLNEEKLFINSNASTSSGHLSIGPYIFSMAKDKKGFSSTPGLYRISLNEENRTFVDHELHIIKDNLFPARQLCIVDEHLGYFYNGGKAGQSIQIFDPTRMQLIGEIDLKGEIDKYRPGLKWVDEAGNNLVRTGTIALDAKEGKLYVSIAFLESADFNLVYDSENHVYLAVIDTETQKFEKIITYEGVNTIGFFVSENKATSVDESGNMYFCSWGWNQVNEHRPSQIFRIPAGETDFDQDWKIDIEKHFGKDHIAQSIIAFNNKVYLHISDVPFTWAISDEVPESIQMSYYEIDPEFPDNPRKLNIPSSNYSTRMNVFSVVDDKLFISVPNIESGKFNGLYSVDKEGNTTVEITMANKYRPTRLYKLEAN